MNERVFSKKCGECRQRAMALAIVPYAIQIDHDGRKYQVVIPALEVPQCGNCHAIAIDAVAEQAISDAFRRQAGLLTPEQIRQGRQHLGRTQQALADLIGVGVSTLSRWETGTQIQQRSLDRLLRVVFAFPNVRAALAGERGLAELGVTQPVPTASSPTCTTELKESAARG